MEAAAEVVAAMMDADRESAGDVAEPEVVPSDQVEAAAQTEHEAEAPELNLDPELPPSIQALLADEPEDEEDDELVADAEPVEDEESDEYVDPEVVRLKTELAKERKRAEYERSLRVKSSRKEWSKEAEKYFPLADSASIDADSRRAFLRQAKEQHERQKNNPRLQAFLEAERIRVKNEATAAWGRPTAGPGAPPSEAGRKQSDIEAARKTGRLHKVIETMLKSEGME